MLLNRQNIKKSEDCAISLLKKYKLKKAPIPIEEIIQSEGLKLVEYNLGDDVSGVLIINDNVGTIGINYSNSYLRQRFTMAHELGHYLMHASKTEVFIDKDFLVKYRHSNNYSTQEKRQEYEANMFAASLLMPKDIIELEMESPELNGLSEVEVIATLANKFKVSEVAMSYRFANLNLDI